MLAAACAVAGLVVDTFDESHPVPTRLAYVQDDDRDRAWWVTTETAPGAWTAGHADAHRPLPADYPYLAWTRTSGPATPGCRPARPVVTPVSDTVVGGRRESPCA